MTTEAATALPDGIDARKALWVQTGAGQPFGKVIEVLRELRGLSRRRLEAASGRSYSQIRGLELGDRWPSDKTLASVAGPLGYTGTALMGLRDSLLGRLASDAPAETAVRDWLVEVGARRDNALAAVAEPDGRLDLAWTQDGLPVAAFEIVIEQGSPKLVATVVQNPLQSMVEAALVERLGVSGVLTPRAAPLKFDNAAFAAGTAQTRAVLDALMASVDVKGMGSALTPVVQAMEAVKPLAEATVARRRVVAELVGALHLRELELVEAYIKGLVDARPEVLITD